MISPQVLVVEPSAEVRRALEEGLGMHGLGVTTVASYEDALELLRSKRFDLVVGSGAPSDASGSLTALHDAFPAIPSIVVTDDVFDPSVFEARRAHGPSRKRLRRPFTLRELIALVRRILAERDEAGPMDRPRAPRA